MCELYTDRLLIRRFNPNDWQELYAYLSQPSVVKYEPYDVCTEDECKHIAKGRSENPAFWAVCLRDSGKLIGNLYFQQQAFKDIKTWDLGYVFHPTYHGMGYATEACKKIINYGFTVLHAHRIVAKCNPKNEPSWHLLERLHMRREAHLKQSIFFKYDTAGNPIWNDTYIYAMLATEWYEN